MTPCGLPVVAPEGFLGPLWLEGEQRAPGTPGGWQGETAGLSCHGTLDLNQWVLGVTSRRKRGSCWE